MLISTYNKLNQLIKNDTNIELIEVWDRVLYLRMRKGKNKFHSKLGIKESDEIFFPRVEKNEYRRLIFKYHPDKNNGKYSELIKQINVLWDIYQTPNIEWDYIITNCTLMNIKDITGNVLIEDPGPIYEEPKNTYWLNFRHFADREYQNLMKKGRKKYVEMEKNSSIHGCCFHAPGIYHWTFYNYPEKWKYFFGDIHVDDFDNQAWIKSHYGVITMPSSLGD